MKLENVVELLTDVVDCVRNMTTNARSIEIEGESGYIVSQQDFEELQDLIFADPDEKQTCHTDVANTDVDLDLVSLKAETLSEDSIVQTKDDYFRFINHKEKLLTIGFLREARLKANMDIIRFDEQSVEKMRESYVLFFGEKENRNEE